MKAAGWDTASIVVATGDKGKHCPEKMDLSGMSEVNVTEMIAECNVGRLEKAQLASRTS